MIATSMNLDTGATARYENFYFNSMAEIDGKTYGINADGLFLLEGNDDAGAPIEACVALGRSDFGTDTLKHLSNIYASVKSETPVAAVVRAESGTFVYEARGASERLAVQRIDTGKGLRETWYDIDLCNTVGSDIEIGAASVESAASRRRI